jgi:hypothetical protein
MSYTPLTPDNLPPHVTAVAGENFAEACRNAALVLNSTTTIEGVIWFAPEYRDAVTTLRNAWGQPDSPLTAQDGIHITKVEITDAQVKEAAAELDRYYKETRLDSRVGAFNKENPHLDTFRDYPGYNAAVFGGRALHVVVTRDGPGTIIYENNPNTPLRGTRGSGVDKTKLGEAFMLPAGAWLFDVNAHWGAKDYEAPADAPAPGPRGLVHSWPTHASKHRKTDVIYCMPPRNPGQPLKPAAEELMIAAQEARLAL